MRSGFSLPFIFLFCSGTLPVYAAEEVTGERVIMAQAASGESGEGDAAVIEADKLVAQKDGQIEASGDATLRQGGKSIQADRLMYQQSTHELDAQGGVILEEGGNVMSGPGLKYNLDSSAGEMQHPEYYLKENDSRGSADLLRMQDSEHYTLENATYTTCPAGNDDWLMRMGSLELNRETQLGVARNATVEFKNVPFLYSPWMDFPLAGQRKSGLLAPKFGSTSKGGSEITVPIYWDIAPNYDATIAPRKISKRGTMLSNEFRYLGATYLGETHFDMLADDALVDRNRVRFSLDHDQALTSRLKGHVSYTRVADDDHFRDLADEVTTTSRVNLLQEGGLDYYADWWSASARVQQYQTLQDIAAPIAVPYARMPQLSLNAQNQLVGTNVSVGGEFVAFTHPTAVSAQRTVMSPSISYPLVNQPAYYVTPKVTLHSTYYSITANNPTDVKDSTRTLPIYSLDSGLALEKSSTMFGGDYLQTLEPRAFYVYAPYRNQDALPVFDSALADFNFTQMFSENRFMGSDRIGDADQLTLALTSRLMDKNTGVERLKIMLGERFSFQSPRVYLPGTAVATTGKSDILLAAAGRVTPAFKLDSEFQYDPNLLQTQRYNVAARYHPEPGKALNLGYRYQRDLLRQIDLSTQWPIYSHWYGVGRWNYSYTDRRILDSSAGLEYNQDCWTLRMVVQHFATATLQTNTSFFVQLELNDFVKVGSDPLELLKQSVPGYTKLNEEPTGKSGLRWQ